MSNEPQTRLGIPEVRQLIGAAQPRFSKGASFCQRLIEAAPSMLGPQIGSLATRHGDRFWSEAERLVGYLEAMQIDGVPALIDYTLENLRTQAAFMADGNYTHETFESAFEAVYDNPEVMGRWYLPGLMLTHAFWPIHFEIHRFFSEKFIPEVPDGGVGAEVGFGHGLYLMDVLKARPGTRAMGLDVSRFAESFAARLRSIVGISEDRCRLGHGDVREALPFAEGEISWAILAEVLEHVPDPAFALREIRRCTRRGGPAFLTTVVDSNAVDHLHQFEDVPSIRAMIADSGLVTRHELVLRIADLGNTRDPTLHYAAVCTPGD